MVKKKNLRVNLDEFNKRSAKDDTKVRAVELAQSMLSGFMHNLALCAEAGRKQYKGDFFIVILRKREIMANKIIRNLFLHRSTCPTPNYEQIVYKYEHNADSLEEVWVIPDRATCNEMRDNIIEAQIHERDLLKYVLDFADGTLMEVTTRLNGEKRFSLELEDEKKKELRK